MQFKKNKKVCILTSVHPPFDTRIFHKEAKSLKDAGYDVVLIAQHNKNEVIDDIKIIAINKPKNRISRMIFTSWNILKKAKKEKADIYHLHDPELLPVGVILKLLTRKKIIYDVHENVKKQILSKHWIPVFLRKIAALSYQVIEKFSLIFIDRIIIAEDSYLENYINYRNNKVVAVRNFPVISNINGENNLPNTHEEHLNVKLIYAGGVSEIRGILEIIEAAGILKSKYLALQLTIVGLVQPESFKEKLTILAQRHELQNNLSILGLKPYKEVCKIISASQVSLCVLHPSPNYVESLPTKLFEYMAAGLPVIASNFPLWKEIVEGNKCGITVDPLNPEEIARAIEYLVENPDVCFEMGRNGGRAVEEKYNWENEAKKLVNLYKNL